MTTTPSRNGLRVGDVVVMQPGPNVPRWLIRDVLDGGRVRISAYDRGAAGRLTVTARGCRRVHRDAALALLTEALG